MLNQCSLLSTWRHSLSHSLAMIQKYVPEPELSKYRRTVNLLLWLNYPGIVLLSARLAMVKLGMPLSYDSTNASEFTATRWDDNGDGYEGFNVRSKSLRWKTEQAIMSVMKWALSTDLGRFSVPWYFTQSVGLSLLQGRYLHTQDSTNAE
jgi:hypothetical protein